MHAIGVSGTIDIVEDEIHIRKFRFFGKSKGVRIISIDSLTAINFVEAGFLSSGYIQFAYPGADESRGILDNVEQNADTVMFNRPSQAAFMAIRDELRGRITNKKTETRTDPVLEIMRLGELRKDGLLTEQEFEAAKRKLLGI